MVAMPAFIAACGLANDTASPSHSTCPSSGRCTPESTLISVDLPAPFWPSRQCTSPARTSNWTPSRARTPGKVLTTSVRRSTVVALRRRPQEGSSYATSLASTAAPTTPARGPSSDSTTGRLPVARGSDRR